MNAANKLTRIQQALDALSVHETECRLCPRQCGANRQNGEKGFCQSGNLASVSHALLHYGEEPVLSGLPGRASKATGNTSHPAGSGTIFFSGCNLKCLFCQNYQLSWLNRGEQVSDEELALMMLQLQEKNALNINLVSPSHVILPILRALKIAIQKGLSIPIVYNSNAYEKAEAIRCLEGIINIYLPDLKYFSPELSSRYSAAPDYFLHASQAILEMYCQQPALRLSKTNTALEGLIIRHLILPGETADSLAVLEWIANDLSPHACLSLMSQYHPCHQAPQEIQRNISSAEYSVVKDKAEELGFQTLFLQPEPFSGDEHLIPDFNLKSPFKWSQTKKSI